MKHKSKSIISSSGGTKYHGPVAKAPSKNPNDLAHRAAGSGSRPVRGVTSTPSSASSDPSGYLGRKPRGTRGDDPA
jgi:hypothetical protein